MSSKLFVRNYFCSTVKRSCDNNTSSLFLYAHARSCTLIFTYTWQSWIFDKIQWYNYIILFYYQKLSQCIHSAVFTDKFVATVIFFLIFSCRKYISAHQQRVYQVPVPSHFRITLLILTFGFVRGWTKSLTAVLFISRDKNVVDFNS